MAVTSVKVWLDTAGDVLEVDFAPSIAGYFTETGDDRIMARVDEHGNVIGFSVLNVSSLDSSSPLQFSLATPGSDE
jgi:hypothetical protein